MVCVEGIITKCELSCLFYPLPCTLSLLFSLTALWLSVVLVLKSVCIKVVQRISTLYLLSDSSSGSLVRPKVVRSVHYCPATKKTMERKYTDMTSLEAFPSSAIYPTKVTRGAQMFYFYISVDVIPRIDIDEFSYIISFSLDRMKRTIL